MYGGQNNAAQAEAILVWLQQEMGYTAVPSAEALGKICRGNMIPVWKFLVERVKAEKTVEEIRRNIHVHGSSITSTAAVASAGVAGAGISSRKEESQEDRPKSQERPRTPKEPEDSKEKILREREAAASEVARMRQTIDRLLKDIKSRMLDLSKEEAERQRVQDEKSNLRHKQVLLESYDQRCEQSSRIFMEYWRRLHIYVDHAREVQRGKSGGSEAALESIHATSITTTGGRLAEGNHILIETAQERSIRQACEGIAANLLEKIRTSFPAYNGGGGHADAQLEVAKLGFEGDGDGISEEVRETATSLLKNPPLLLRALAAYTSRVVAMLAREIEKIDIRADAERLRYRFENNRVVEDSSAEVDDLLVAHRRSSRGGGTKGSLDLSSKSSFRQLRERQRAHVQQFMATEDALNQAAQAKKLSDELIRRIHGAADGADAAVSMVTKDGTQNAGSLRQFELEVWTKERELAGMRASVNTLTLEVQRLQKKCQERREAEEALCEKWKRIEEFDARRLELESIYTALLRANMAAAATWEQHAKGNKEHSAATIVPVCEAVQSKASAARDLLEREVAAFLRSPDNRLYMMPAGPQALLDAMGASTSAGSEAVAVAERNADLITSRAGAGDPSAFPSILRIPAAAQYSSGSEGADVGLASVVDAMRFFLRPGGSPANLLEDLARAVNQVQTLRDLVGSGRSLLAIANSSRPEYERTAGACAEKAAEQEKIALEEWLPQLKVAVQEAQHCLEDCKRVRGLVDEWWEQPASTAVDWVTVDGQNVAAWLAHVKQLQTAFYEKQLL
ncbi:unnamed protein product [Sphagnum troendelagicum]|uniref:AUGMIN subunit 5 n=1 Tax=Sphagnum troendelagicum TaxID=128251 RepID=A0ABP0T877_9BRYO